MHTIRGSLDLVHENSSVYWFSNDSIYATILRTYLLGTLFSQLAGLLLILTLAELGKGFLFCLTRTRTALQKAVRNAGIASCLVLFSIVIAAFGVMNKAYSQYLEAPYLYVDWLPLPSAGMKLNAAIDTFYLFGPFF